MYDWVVGWADTKYGTPALGGISFAESSFFPIPPDPLLVALCVGKRERSLWYGTVCTVASVLGGLFGYWIGANLFDSIGQPIVDFYGKQEVFDDLQEKFQTYGFLAVLTAALTPVPYKIITITAGVCGVNLWTFTIASVIGRGARFYAEAILIRIFGESIRDFIDRYFDLCAIAFLVLLVLGFVLFKVVL